MTVRACVTESHFLAFQITTAWSMSWPYTLVTFVVIYSFAITNTVLCYRVMAADGLLGKRRARASTNPPIVADTTNAARDITDPTGVLVVGDGLVGPGADDEYDETDEDEVLP